MDKELINKTESEVKKMRSDCKLEYFSPEKVVLYEELNGFCNQHYLIKSLDDCIAIYTIDVNGNERLQEKTSIAVEYLSEFDKIKLENGIQAIGKEELNSKLEDYE